MQQFAPVEYIKVILEFWLKSSQLSDENLLNSEQHEESVHFFSKSRSQLRAMQQQYNLSLQKKNEIFK